MTTEKELFIKSVKLKFLKVKCVCGSFDTKKNKNKTDKQKRLNYFW